MKRCITIALISLLLFNMMGFYGVLEVIRYQNDVSLTAKLQSDRYNKSREQLIKVPVSLPYPVDQSDWQLADGDFNYLGEHYHLVKQRLSQDTLYVICYPDEQNKKIDQALSDYVKSFTHDSHRSNQTGKISLTFAKDYLINTFCFASLTCGWELEIPSANHDHGATSSFFASITHPPQLG